MAQGHFIAWYRSPKDKKRESGINFENYLISHFSKTIAGEGRIDRSTKVKMFLTPFSYDGNYCKI